MTYEQMKDIICNYNWDDGFHLPKRILEESNCDLALALEIFYLGDGLTYFNTPKPYTGNQHEWYKFISDLYDSIESGKYQKTEHHFNTHLTKVEKYILSQKNLPSVFLTDL